MSRYPYDAILILSFGGPEGMDDVMPFLDNVLRGRNVPEERKHEVAHHYELFGGISPLNAQNRALQVALEAELHRHGIDLRVRLGNRNWKPYLTDVMREWARDGVKKILVFVTAGFSSYSGCRQYREDLARAQAAIGPTAPAYDKIRVYYNHPLFIDVWRRNWQAAQERIPADRRAGAVTLFTSHSIPSDMAEHCDYEAQLKEACRLTVEAAGIGTWRLVYQSRSGPPHQPWLEPDICDALRELKDAGTRDVILAPIGFISDHMEVLYDLDHEAKDLCGELGLNMVRAATPSTHPLFIAMVRELIEERLDPSRPKRALGARGPNHDECPADCCPPPRSPGRPGGAMDGTKKP